MRLAHLGSTIDLVCSVTDRLFSEGIKEIADWLDQPGNEHELVKIYMNVSLATAGRNIIYLNKTCGCPMECGSQEIQSLWEINMGWRRMHCQKRFVHSLP